MSSGSAFHVGDIIFDDNDIFGDGVNIAARLEGIAEPGGICISDDAHRQIRSKLNVSYDDMGPRTLKNIAEPMRAWRLRPGGEVPSVIPSGPTSEPLLALPNKPSIAVLPFQNMSGDLEQEYFADGIVEDIITALSQIKSLFVIARNSSFTYKGRAVDVKQVGRELGVRYILEGSVRKSGRRLRITAQLIDAATGARTGRERMPKLKDWHGERWNYVTTMRTVLGWAGYSLAIVVGALADASAFIGQALELNPNLALVWGASGWMKVRIGEQDLAIEHFTRAIRLNPLDPGMVIVQSGTANAHFCAGRYDEAASWAGKALRTNPNALSAVRVAAATNALIGRPEDARKAMDHLLQLDPTRCISNLREATGPHQPEDFARFVDGLRKAGMPE